MINSLSRAQSNLLFYHENELFNASNYNPAFINSQEKFTLSIFPLAGTSVNFNDKEAIAKISDILFYDQVNNALKNVFRSMVNKDLYYQNAEISLLNFGYHSDFGSISFTVKDHVNLMIDFKDDLSKFLMNKNYEEVRLNQQQALFAEAIHFREYGLGYAKEIIKNKLRFGLRAKLYFGKSFFLSEVSAVTVEDNNNFLVQLQGPMKISVPAKRELNPIGSPKLTPFDNSTIGDYLINSKNFGTGFDLGFTYKITRELELSASVIDLGNIRWKENLHSMAFDGQYQLDNDDIAKVFADDGSEILIKKNLQVSLDDSISQLFYFPVFDETPYSQPLPTTIYAGLQYKVNPQLKVGIVDRYVKAQNLGYNSLSITAHIQTNEHITFSTGYSIYGNSYFNIPLGILYKWDAGQAYIGSDNLASFIIPSQSDFYGFTFGATFYVFRSKLKYDRIYYLPFFKRKKEKPKDKKGLIFKGNP